VLNVTKTSGGFHLSLPDGLTGDLDIEGTPSGPRLVLQFGGGRMETVITPESARLLIRGLTQALEDEGQ
jgi:hypothetical protein